MESAWWVAQIVADQVYTRKERAAPVVLAARKALDETLDAALAVADAKAQAKFNAGDMAGGQKVLNEHAIAAGAAATDRWAKLWQELMVSFIDGRITTVDRSNQVCGCKKTSAKFGDAWKGKVVADAGDHYRVPEQCDEIHEAGACARGVGAMPHGNSARDKLSIMGVAS